MTHCVVGKCSTANILFINNLLLLVVDTVVKRGILPSDRTSANCDTASVIRCIGVLLVDHNNSLNVVVVVLYNFTTCVARVNTGSVIIGLTSGPLRCVGSPCLLVVTTCFITYLVSLTISSTANLNILLVTALFPIVMGINVDHNTTTTVYTSPTTVVLTPASKSIILTTRTSRVSLVSFTFGAALPVSVTTVVNVTVTRFF